MVKITLQTWLTTCFIGSLLVCAALSRVEAHIRGDEYLLILGIAFGITLVASIPAMIIYGILAHNLSARMEVIKAKAICSAYAVVATAGSMTLLLLSRNYLLPAGFDGGLLLFAVPYMVSFVLAVWLFRWPAWKPSETVMTDLMQEPEAEARPFPQKHFYTISAIAALILLTGIAQWLSGNFHDARFMAFLALGILDAALLGTGLVLFASRRPAGWKILILLFIGGLTGSAIALATTWTVFVQHPGPMLGYLLRLGLFTLLDLMAIFLLSKDSLRNHYRISAEDYRTWLLAGLGYGLLRGALAWMLMQ